MGDNLGGSLGIGDAPGVGQELTCRAGIQPASAVSGSWEPDNSTNIWQRNYYEHVIRDQHDYERITGYIAANPGNWASDEENPNRLQSLP